MQLYIGTLHVIIAVLWAMHLHTVLFIANVCLMYSSLRLASLDPLGAYSPLPNTILEH